MAVTDPVKVDRVRTRAYKGLQGKINLWLSRSPVAGFLILAVPSAELKADRPEALPRTVMAAEDCVLWITEEGLGSCWLGGVSERDVKSVLGLGADTWVPAIISFGKPKEVIRARDMDSFTYHRISRKRKPLADISYLDDMEHRYNPADFGTLRFEAAPGQGTRALIESLLKDEPASEPPLEILLEACLEGARIAPSGGNAQSWHFVVVTDPGRTAEIASACGDGEEWRAAVVAAGESGGFSTKLLDKPFWMIDVPIALSNMSLVAASMGASCRVLTEGIDEKAIDLLVRARETVRTVGVLAIQRGRKTAAIEGLPSRIQA